MRVVGKKIQTVEYSIELTREETERLANILGHFSKPNLAELMNVRYPSEAADKNHKLTNTLYLAIKDHMREEERNNEYNK